VIPQTAIVLAGGFGTRLKSVVQDLPKPMAPINEQPFLEHLLSWLSKAGITTVVLATGYKGRLIEEHFGDHHNDLNILYSQEHVPLGTGGAVQRALKRVNSSDPVWVLNGDTFFNCDLTAIAVAHREATADVTLALCSVDPADRYGLVDLDEEHLIRRFREKQIGAAGLINAGVYLLDPEALQRFDFPESFSLERDFFEQHLLDLRLVGSPQAGYFIDIGVPEDYARAQKELLSLL